MGVVYHANYLVWMEVGRVEYFRAAGLRYRDFEQQTGLRLAVVEAGCRYLAPARYDEEVLVRTSIQQSSTRMIVFSYQIVSVEGGRTLATGHTKHMFLADGGKARKLPPEFRSVFGLGDSD